MREPPYKVFVCVVLRGLLCWGCGLGGERLGIIWIGFTPDWGDLRDWLLAFMKRAMALTLCTRLVIVVMTVDIC